MLRSFPPAVMVLVCILSSGCNLASPNWLHPGGLAYQRQRAMLHDPYVDNDAGPEVVGLRPRDFERKRPPEPGPGQPFSLRAGY